MRTRTGLQRKVDALQEITRAFNASLGQREVLDIMLERTCAEIGCKGAALRLLDEGNRRLELEASFGLSPPYLAKGTVEVSESAVDRTILSGKRVTIDDAGKDAGLQYPEAAAEEGLASMLGVPVSLREHIIGVLHVYSGEPRKFSAEEESYVAAVADFAAQIIRRTHCFAAFQRVAHNINSSLELKDVLQTLLLESVKEVSVKAGSIRLLGPKGQTLQLAAACGLSETYLKKGAVRISQSPIDQRVLAEGLPVTIDATQESAFQYTEEARQEGIRSVLVLPLRSKETIIGVMRLYSSQIRRFSSEETTFGLALADLGAVAIENAKLHHALKQRLEALKEDANGWYRFLTFG